MTSKQRTVIWIGLIIIALNLVTKWASVKAIVFNGAGLSSSSSSSSSSAPQTGPQGAGQNNGVQPTPTPNVSPTPPQTQVA